MSKDMSRTKAKTRIGKVVSSRMTKTIVVSVERLFSHPVYKRRIYRYSRFKVHDEKQQAQVGDKVRIELTRPISKEKRWRLVEILK